jgi:hypothetical protein
MDAVLLAVAEQEPEHLVRPPILQVPTVRVDASELVPVSDPCPVLVQVYPNRSGVTTISVQVQDQMRIVLVASEFAAQVADFGHGHRARSGARPRYPNDSEHEPRLGIAFRHLLPPTGRTPCSVRPSPRTSEYGACATEHGLARLRMARLPGTASAPLTPGTADQTGKLLSTLFRPLVSFPFRLLCRRLLFPCTLATTVERGWPLITSRPSSSAGPL